MYSYKLPAFWGLSFTLVVCQAVLIARGITLRLLQPEAIGGRAHIKCTT